MTSFNRRDVIKGALTAATAAGIGPILSVESFSQTKSVLNLQLGWLSSGNQLGEVCAKALGYYEAEGIDLKLQPGGPNIDGVAVVAAGRFEAGQVSSSPSLMLAASQDIPIKCFATGAQVHPYTFFSLKKNPVREPKDLVGKKVGIQSTGVILLRALLAKNKIADKDVTIIPIGAEMSPLLTGQVDVVTGWLTNTTALKVLGDQRVDMRLWDTGVKLYALPYYATVDTLTKKPEVLAKFLRATSQGWAFARGEPEKAVDLLVKEFPNLDRADEIDAAKVMLQYAFSDKTKAEGWGAMDPAVWQDQIALYAELGQFSKRVPKLDEVMTLDILKMTADTRVKLG
ncbi:NitT/TauT family transport system substrate-binding protein [Nitrobacteraceae bacterium AZCC 2161]|jgi:NitT/TauT family transport system substrate-binding protein